MKIKITEPYLWLPVDAKEEKVLLHLYSEGEKIDEIAIRLGVTDCDYYAYKDVSAYKNKELEIIRYDEGNLDRIFQYPEKPQTVYPFRPKLHYHMAAGWCNDPCGLVYADGIYHLYHQCNPYGPEWENMHWGHAVSTEPHIPEVRSWIRRICWDTAKMPCSFITLRQAEKTSGPGLQENSSTLPNGYTIRQTVEKHWCGMIVF